MKRWLLLFALCLLPLAAHATTTCGYTAVGSNQAAQNNTMRAAAPCTAALSFNVVDCQIYQGSGSTGAIGCAIYDALGGGGAPGTKICEGSIGSSTQSAFNSITLSGCGTIAAGIYWVTYNYTNGTTAYDNVNNSYYNIGPTCCTFPGTFPSPTSQGITASAYLDISLLPNPGHHQAIVAASSTLQPSQPLLALTPPMGWNAWRPYLNSATEAEVLANAAQAVTDGLVAKGYVYFNPDSTYNSFAARDSLPCGPLTINGNYPNGLKYLCDGLHADGAKCALYLSYGNGCNLQFAPTGTSSCEQQDAQQLAAAGMDFLKYDSCDTSLTIGLWPAKYQIMQNALTTVGRPVVYEISADLNIYNDWIWGGGQGGNTILTGEDPGAMSWGTMTSQIDDQYGKESYVHLGRWNFIDVLGVGNGTLTDAEGRTNMAIWSILASPLVIGIDLTASPSGTTLATLGNTNVIAVDQDAAGIGGKRVSRVACGGANCECYARQLSSGKWAVVGLNRDSASHTVACSWSDFGQSGPFTGLDDWSGSSLGSLATGYSATVTAHDNFMVTLTP